MYRTLQKVLNRIGEQVDTGLRAVTDRYYICLDPNRAGDGANEFPVQYRPHGHHPDRCTEPGYREVLCFHVSHAFLTYYDLLNGTAAGDASKVFDRLVKITDDLTQVRVDGTNQTGYSLITVAERDEKLRQEEEEEANRWEKENKRR